MSLNDLYDKASKFGFLSVEEGVYLYQHAPLAELMFVADELRKKQVPHGKVTWQIDRNVNTTNVCIANCKFCNFYRIPGHAEAYITDMPTYRKKIEETIKWGGDQLLLQGGHHPELGLQFYVGTFSQIKNSHTNRAGWGWSVAFFDYDNDSKLDIYAANGWISNAPNTDL